jgi:hypothetical protein
MIREKSSFSLPVGRIDVTKKSIADILRKVAGDLAPSHFNAVIQFVTKNVYSKELVYVTSEHKEALETLTGKKTLTDSDVKALKNLGFVFHHIPDKRVLS